MNRSEQIGELVSALAKAQTQFTPALKDSNNPYFSSKYADLATVIDAVRPALNKNGIAILQFNSSDLEHQTASVTTSLHFGEQFMSETMEAPAIGKAKDGKDKFDVQTLGAAWTYLRRYGIQSICGLASEDDDGNSLQNDNKPVFKPTKRPPTEWEKNIDVSSRHSEDVPPYTQPDKATLTWEKQKPSPVTIAPEEWERRHGLWTEAFGECPTIEDWNALVVPMMKERADHPDYGRQFIIASAEEAKRRGYVGDRTSGAYRVGGTTPPKYSGQQNAVAK